jgi:hypothetical protein
MSRVVTFIDTSVLLEVLKVPGKNQRPVEIAEALRDRVKANESLILPTAAIIETGNHIAQVPGGASRRSLAGHLSDFLKATINDNPPWTLNGARWDADLLNAICDGTRGCPALPDMAMRGVGAGDVSILAEAEAYERRVANVKVSIWTLDDGLAAYS